MLLLYLSQMDNKFLYELFLGATEPYSGSTARTMCSLQLRRILNERVTMFTLRMNQVPLRLYKPC